jgi:cellulose synthase/poly-beta-1,6-N-acetylglucosamine synthase-like glycosyltransferase
VTVSASPATAGKSVALAAGLSASMRTDLVAIADADFEMEADGLRRLADGFSDAKVGAVCGYLRPRNAGAGIVARYAALESWLHQLVTATAKDRLGLDPPLLGIWVVRRAVLDAVGGFPARSTGEDVQVGTAVSRHGFRTRFVPTPVASNAVAATLAEYWWQHLRWARDVYASARSRRPESQNLEGGGSSRASLGDLGRGIERLLSAAGYADRLALVAGMTLTALGALPSVILLAYLAAVALEIVVAIRRGGSRRLGETVRVLASVVAMVGVDVFATAVATVAAMAGTNPSWRRPARRPSP